MIRSHSSSRSGRRHDAKNALAKRIAAVLIKLSRALMAVGFVLFLVWMLSRPMARRVRRLSRYRPCFSFLC
jgi:uncharacterized membrane protein YadS